MVLGSNPVAVFSYYGIFLDSSRKTNGNVLEMKLKDFIFFDGQIEIKSIIPIFIPERKQKCLSQKKKINMSSNKYVIKKVSKKEPFIKICSNLIPTIDIAKKLTFPLRIFLVNVTKFT